MDGESNTTVNKFPLFGLTGSIVVRNFIIMVLLICEPRLQTSMYILLGNFSFLDCCYSSMAAPKRLTGFLSPPQTISFVGCMVQIFFFHFTRGIKIFLLTVIVYDHYVAIFHTLRYMIVINQMVCEWLLVTCLVGGFLYSVIQVAIIVQLSFCGPKELDKFYCDVPQVVKLVCTDTIVMELLMISSNGLVTVLCFTVLVISYSILLVNLNSHASQEQHDGLSTCFSHITVITVIFGPCICIYTRPFTSCSTDKAISLLCTIITPILNWCP
ncbi:PREDICTED: LOW QUALITY PROTEIN: olfactory receptor 4D5-like [Tauraco erythrolophus]|uniref:LOW QUALITY PROTEIN: olfactory receptor 4D5-like n=1 Tax=Tauraco erythrolophus TaxID=121530 RepID=UPI00052323CF|nr:PREDICTED: LOW QUALITY PROTEIN: olfactory receptor 4D5-like [Tauraco erythrolophus]